jgi:serine/threonine protein kinase
MPDEQPEQTQPRQPQVGEYLGHYRLVELLAIGGMALVFRGFDKNLERYVAIKVLKPELAADAEFAAQFLREARAVASLNHPNIVHVYYAGQENGVYFFAMELVEGQHLESLLTQHKRFHIREATEWIRQAALGLKHAHEHGLIHGDIKPTNLMVTRTGSIKVTDFGLARHAKHDPAAAASDTFHGTPEYLSPEVIKGSAIDQRSDIYSLGATFYHMLASRPPFTGDTPQQIIRQHLETVPPPIQQLNPQVPPALSRIVITALAKDPAARYADYDELIRAITSFLSSRPILQARSSGAPAPPKRSTTSQQNTLIAAAAIVAVVLIAGWFAVQQLARPVPTPTPAPPPTILTADGPTTLTGPPDQADPLVTSPADYEELARKTFVTLKGHADPLVQEGRLGDAFAVYDRWPAEYANTAANEWLDAQRENIRSLAKSMWEETHRQAQSLHTEHRYEEAARLYQQLARATRGIDDFAIEANRQRDLTLETQRDHEARLAEQRAEMQRTRQARLDELRAQVSRFFTAFQYDNALATARQATEHDDPVLRDAARSLRDELQQIVALRNSVFERARDPASPGVNIPTRFGAVQGRVANLDGEKIVVRQAATTGGFFETTVHWSDLPGIGLAHFFAAHLDAANTDELFSYAVLLVYLFANQQLGPDEPRQAFQALLRRDPGRAELVQTWLERIDHEQRRLQQLAAARQREQLAESLWRQLQTALPARQWPLVREAYESLVEDCRDTEFVRARVEPLRQTHQLLREQFPPATPLPLDISSLCNADIVHSDTHIATDWFDYRGKRTWATTAYFRANGIQESGLPDDGRIPIPNGQPAGFFQLRVPPASNAILLNLPGAYYPSTVRLDLPHERQLRYTQIAFLTASSAADAEIQVTAAYDRGENQTFLLPVIGWRQRAARPRPDEPVRVALTAMEAGQNMPVRLYSQTVRLDSQRRLRSLVLTFHGDARTNAGIFAITATPAELPGPP